MVYLRHMDSEQRLINCEKMLRELLREKRKSSDEWFTPEQASDFTGYSLETLRKKRQTGELKRWRYMTKNGRNVQYNKEELEELFTEVKN